MNGNARRAAPLAACAIALVAFAAPSSAQASTVTQWNEIAAGALTAAQAPPVAVIHLAMVHGAVFDAVNAIDGGYTPYLVKPSATPFDSQDAAVATAAYEVLSSILPAQEPTFRAARDATLNATPAGAAKTGGINAGHTAAQAMIANRMNDGRFGAPGFPVPAAPTPGQWRPVLPAFVNDPNAWVRFVRPFMIESADQFRTKGPWAITSPQYAREFDEVKSVGALNSTTRTPDQTNAARYWGVNPPATWSRIVRLLDAQEGLSTADAARLYAELYLTAADGFIAVWDDKAYWSFWRPITAIREADTDGNPRTEKDPNWLPLLANPPYPDHPSGHLALSGGFVETLQEFFHKDHMGWTDTVRVSPTETITRTYTSFSDALKDIIGARIWAGIHFRAADEQTAELAKDVAKWRQHHYFKKAH